mmetsp:Transcript_33787/g.24831  ORF Transcript_33787/g.24831 Transcript_33787/m.24831 type:complete len:230 (-) Transcript_33787:22-711(-)
MLDDPYLSFAKCFATWFRIQVLMGFMIAWSIILMSLSAWQMQNSTSSAISNITFTSNNSYKDWSGLCNSMPYAFLSPFQFTASGDSTSSATSYCPWPTPNSELRITMTVFSIVTLLALYVKTPFSLIARMIFAIYAFIFFATFVIDAVAVTAGQDFCNQQFPNTILNQDLKSRKVTLTCSAGNFEVIPVFDLILSCLYFLLYTAWHFTSNLYVTGTKTERKGLLSTGGK